MARYGGGTEAIAPLGRWAVGPLGRWAVGRRAIKPAPCSIFAEIVGCYLPYLWLRKSGSPWLIPPAFVSLAVFSRRLANRISTTHFLPFELANQR
jgi:hypothetical protein